MDSCFRKTWCKRSMTKISKFENTKLKPFCKKYIFCFIFYLLLIFNFPFFSFSWKKGEHFKTKNTRLYLFLFFSDSFDYLSTLPYQPTQHVINCKHLATPTHYFAYVPNEWSPTLYLIEEQGTSEGSE